ncbi:MAG: DNA repair protein RadC [Eubacteriales bacterium]|nr:DNA repair protein RadC [Eubacteriales bacterium]
MEKLRIYDLPRDCRPYEKLEDNGEAALADAELLAIIINSGSQGKTALDIAQNLLAEGRNLEFIRRASLMELQEFPGIGRVKALRLKAALELATRLFCKATESGDLITSPEAAAGYISHKLANLDHEQFHCIYLDCRKRVIRSEMIATGGLDSTVVKPREVFRRALRLNAHSLILSHNHPSGNPDPSPADIRSTEAFCDLGKKLGIPVLDHLIIADTTCLSLREEGLMPV